MLFVKKEENNVGYAAEEVRCSNYRREYLLVCYQNITDMFYKDVTMENMHFKCEPDAEEFQNFVLVDIPESIKFEMDVTPAEPNTEGDTLVKEEAEFVEVKEEIGFEDCASSEPDLNEAENSLSPRSNRGVTNASQQNSRRKKLTKTNNRDLYYCTTCSKPFNTRSRLHRHNLIHTKDKPFSCTICGMTFSQTAHLKRHQSTHSGNKPFPCTTCGMMFSQTAHLKRHQITHSGDRPYCCSTCGKSFARLGCLKVHQKCHSDEKPYSCNSCSKSFRHMRSLRAHHDSHSGERSYSCAICGKAFVRRDLLSKHILLHSKVQPYSCLTCGETFRFRKYLRKHLRFKHL